MDTKKFFTGKAIGTIIIMLIAVILVAISRMNRDENNISNVNANTITENELNTQELGNITPDISETELAQLKSKIEQDESSYGDNYREFTHTAYTRKPDRIVYKQGNKNGFHIYEKDDENYKHLLEVSEDRMAYSVMEDFNLWCFTPDSISTMMSSGDNYIIFDYDNGDLAEYDANFQKDLIFRFAESTRLYRLVSYLSYYKELIPKDRLGKEEFATNTNISGYKYMIYNDYND